MKISLKKQLDNAFRNLELERDARSQMQERAFKAESELRKITDQRFLTVNERFEREHEKSDVLLEIIRWMVKPDNSADPYNEIARQKNKNLSRNF